ncbi:hypothetical protein GW781_06300 [bacterium]|nr:hypothetical protein [bacterium]NCT20748.1 hypothetical protein [bacterium]OIO84088.1 MAG: hypothetical protein AUK01_10605 [Anaerolineae bacterium CG2_30_57_67]
MNWFLRNVRTFGLAFALALVVWISAVVAADPDETRVYPHAVTLEMVGQDPSMVLTGKPPTQVTLTLRAPRSVWEQLTASPDQVRVVIDLAGLAAGEHALTPQVQVNARPVRVVAVSPEKTTVFLEPLATQVFDIHFETTGEPAIGYQAGSPALDVRRVTVSGPQSLVEQVSLVQARIALANARATLESAIPVQALDANGQAISGLTLTPAQIKVSLPVTQQGGYRDLAVKVLVRGQVADGYRLTSISVFPPTITVYSGDPALVNNLPGYVETEALNLSGASQQIERLLSLTLPSGVSVVGDQTVLVQVGVAAIEGSLALNNMQVTLVGLAPGLSVQIAPETLDIILTGPLPFLDGLTAAQIEITIDVTGLGAGTYQLTPEVKILVSDIQVQSINPATVEVIIAPPATP